DSPMRAPARFVASAISLGVALAIVAGTAAGKPKKKATDEDSEAVTPDVKKGLIVLSDGEGTVIAVDKAWTDEHWVFYGDGKTMYRQRVHGGGADGSAGTWSYNFWSPRVHGASIEARAGGKFFVACDDQSTELHKLADVDARKVLDAAAWKKP